MIHIAYLYMLLHPNNSFTFQVRNLNKQMFCNKNMMWFINRSLNQELGSTVLTIFSSAYLLQLAPLWTKYRLKLPVQPGSIHSCGKIHAHFWRSCSLIPCSFWRELQYSFSSQCKGFWSQQYSSIQERAFSQPDWSKGK